MPPEDACHEEQACAHLRTKVFARRSPRLYEYSTPDQRRGTQEIFMDDVLLATDLVARGLAHRQDALSYALEYARDMDRSLADKFVGMYVNDWTLDYGPRGRAAVARLLEEGHKAGIIAKPVAVEFVE